MCVRGWVRTTKCTMEEKERNEVLGIKTYLFIVYLATVSQALAENSLQAPRFTTSSSSSSIIRLGTTKIMQCQAFGNPSPQFRWLKDGVPITEFSTDAYYKIFSASHKDEGSYRCIASNKIGSIVSEEMKILVAYMNVFEDQTEKSVSVTEGEAAILDLPEIESKPPPEVTWHTDEGQLPYAQKYAKSKTNQLIILSTDQSDQRAYRARAINTQEGKEENSAFIRLTVRPPSDENKEVPPQIIVAPEDAKIVKGTAQSTLDCIANAKRLHELETLWFKDDILIENGGMYSLNDIWNRSLTLISVNTTHSGRYECRVRLRSERFDTVKASATVEVLEKPRFVSATRAETLGEYGMAISLPCDVVGIPKPQSP